MQVFVRGLLYNIFTATWPSTARKCNEIFWLTYFYVVPVTVRAKRFFNKTNWWKNTFLLKRYLVIAVGQRELQKRSVMFHSYKMRPTRVQQLYWIMFTCRNVVWLVKFYKPVF